MNQRQIRAYIIRREHSIAFPYKLALTWRQANNGRLSGFKTTFSNWTLSISIDRDMTINLYVFYVAHITIISVNYTISCCIQIKKYKISPQANCFRKARKARTITINWCFVFRWDTKNYIYEVKNSHYNTYTLCIKHSKLCFTFRFTNEFKNNVGMLEKCHSYWKKNKKLWAIWISKKLVFFFLHKFHQSNVHTYVYIRTSIIIIY